MMTARQARQPLRVFLGGPIHHAVSADGYDEQLRNLIQNVLRILEAKGHEVFSAHVVEGFGTHSAAMDSHHVVRRDFDWMNRCDVFIAVLPPDNHSIMRTDGTFIELGWASALDKPTLLIAPDPLPAQCAHMLKGLDTFTNIDLVNIDEATQRPQTVTDVLLHHPAFACAQPQRHRQQVHALAATLPDERGQPHR